MSVYNVILDNILKAMEKGIVPWKSPYTARGHRNIDGRLYHGINIFSLNIACWIYGYETPIWLTWKQIKNNGWSLKKGSRNVRVIFFKEVEKEITNEDGSTEIEFIPVPRYYHVFNLECLEEFDSIKRQFETEPAPPMESLLKGYIDNSGVKLIHSSYGVSYYEPRRDRIVMAPVKQSAYYQVLAHEIVHSTGHSKRLNRIDNSFFESKQNIHSRN